RGACGRDNQFRRSLTILSTKLTRQLKGNKGSHAVPEESVWRLKEWPQCFAERGYERGDSCHCWFTPVSLTARQLDGVHVDAGRQPGRPGAEHGGAPARMGKAKQTDSIARSDPRDDPVYPVGHRQ